jgi:hypothetical protein
MSYNSENTDSISVVFIPIKGDPYVVKKPMNIIFNEIGKFITTNKDELIEPKMCFHTENMTYELLSSNNQKNYYPNKLASGLVFPETLNGNIVLIGQSDTLVSIILDDLYMILSKKRNPKAILINVDGGFSEFKYYLPFAIDIFKKKLNTDLIEEKKIGRYISYGYEMFFYFIPKTNAPLNKIASRLLTTQKVYGDVILINQMENSMVDVSTRELKQFYYISCVNNHKEDPNIKKKEDSIIKNRYKCLDHFYNVTKAKTAQLNQTGTC